MCSRDSTGRGNPGKPLNWKKKKLFSSPRKSWNFNAGPRKSWKSELDCICYWNKCSEVFNWIEHDRVCKCQLPDFLSKIFYSLFLLVFSWLSNICGAAGISAYKYVYRFWENLLPICDLVSWKFGKNSWKGTWIFFWADDVRALI